MEVPPPILAVFLPCRLPWFFVFLLSDRFVPFVLMALGHRTALLGPPKYKKKPGFSQSLTNGYVMLMSPNKGETAVHGCHYPRAMALRMLEVMARL